MKKEQAMDRPFSSLSYAHVYLHRATRYEKFFSRLTIRNNVYNFHRYKYNQWGPVILSDLVRIYVSRAAPDVLLLLYYSRLSFLRWNLLFFFLLFDQSHKINVFSYIRLKHRSNELQNQSVRVVQVEHFSASTTIKR